MHRDCRRRRRLSGAGQRGYSKREGDAADFGLPGWQSHARESSAGPGLRSTVANDVDSGGFDRRRQHAFENPLQRHRMAARAATKFQIYRVAPAFRKEAWRVRRARAAEVYKSAGALDPGCPIRKPRHPRLPRPTGTNASVEQLHETVNGPADRATPMPEGLIWRGESSTASRSTITSIPRIGCRRGSGSWTSPCHGGLGCR